MLRRLARSYHAQRCSLAIITGLSLLSAFTEAAALIAIAPLIQSAAEGLTEYAGGFGPIEATLSLGELAAVAATMLVVAMFVQLISSYVVARVISGRQLAARLKVLDAFQGAEWGVQAEEREGWLITILGENVNRSAQGLRDIAGWLKAATGLAVFAGGALIVNAMAVLVIVVVMGLLALCLRPVNALAKRLSSEQVRYNVASNEELSTLTSTARELQVFGAANEAGKPFRRIAEEQRRIRQRTDVVVSLTGPVFRTVGLLLIVGLIAITANRGNVEVATVGLVAVLLYRSFSYGESLVSLQQKLVQLVPALDQLETAVTKLDRSRLADGSESIEGFHQVELSQVTFCYPGAQIPALQDFSLRIQLGEIVGVVGPSGSGKSTLAELLLGLRKPGCGTISVDGVDLSALSDRSRSEQISLVSQTVPLVPGSLRDNVRFFRDIDDQSVDQALEASGLSAVVRELPLGADTQIGPGARAVSGGQAQRIGIARALAGRPGLLVLDEPTSALDATAEEIVTDLIGSLRGSIAVVVIAHRLTTLRHCDRIVVIEGGIKSGEGTFASLGKTNEFLRHALATGTDDLA